ncbi:MAG: hypothetical protein ABI024_01125, partial [Vicinamibacterales bacterium]
AVCMVIQTLMFVTIAVGAYIAYRRAGEALAEVKLSAQAHIEELRGQIQRVAATVDDTAAALKRGTSAVGDVMTDVRDAMGTVRNSVGTVASVVSGPRTALALGLWKGLQTWRRRRDAQRVVAATPSDV